MNLNSVFAKAAVKKDVIKAMLKLFLAFGSSLLVFLIAFNIEAVHLNIVIPFTYLVAKSSSLLMNLFGADSLVEGNRLITSAFRIDVVDGCNGIYATAILISGVIAFPAGAIEKLWGVILGTMAIFILNLGRVISLFYLGQFQPDIFQEVHVYVWQPIIIIWALFIWDFWSRRIGRKIRPV